MEKFISKAATLVEALPYIQRFRSQIFVVKYGGSFMDSPDPEERHRVARDVVFLEAVGINPVVVHGGGKAITRALEGAGVKSQFIGYAIAVNELRFHAGLFERTRDCFAAAVHNDGINSDRFEKNDIARDPVPFFGVRRVHETAAVLHDKDLTAEALDVRQCFDQRGRF